MSRPRLRPRKAVRLTPDLGEATASPLDGGPDARLTPRSFRGGERLRSPMPTIVDYSTKIVDYSTITRGAEGRRKPPMMGHAPRARRQPRVTDFRPAYLRRELNFIYIERDVVCGLECGCGTSHEESAARGGAATEPNPHIPPRPEMPNNLI